MPDHPDDETIPAPSDAPEVDSPEADAPKFDSPKFGEPGSEPPVELDQGPLVA